LFTSDGQLRKQMSLDGEEEGEDDEYECYYIGEEETEEDSNVDSNNESFEVKFRNQFKKPADVYVVISVGTRSNSVRLFLIFNIFWIVSDFRFELSIKF
jgi:hypothetical protein